jgi:fructose 1,6-bisphosphatase
MRLTLSVIKADVGSVGGHTKPSSRMLATVEGEVAKAICNGLLIDGFICHTGDDIAIVMTHTRGEGSSEVHQFAWKTFLAATSVAKMSGLYGAGQDLLADAPSGNIRGAGPGVAELSFDHSLSGPRPAESFMVFAADRFSESFTDFFDNPAWDEVRRRAQRKAIEMRSQGWSGAAMLPYSELEYGGFRDTVSALLKRFRLREERKPEAAE